MERYAPAPLASELPGPPVSAGCCPRSCTDSLPRCPGGSLSRVGCDQSDGGTHLPGLPGRGADLTVLSEEPGEGRAAWKHGQDAAGEAEMPPHALIPGQETTLSRTDAGIQASGTVFCQ